MERDDQGRKRARIVPWLLLAPGLLFLLAFFFWPLYTLLRMSLSKSPAPFADPVFGWEWSNFGDAFTLYGDQFVRSFVYGAAATAFALVIAYPLAYVIAFRGGRFKSLLLGLVVVPFFTNFLIRTLAWKTILGDEGVIVKTLRDIGVLGANGALLRTPIAVIRRSSTPRVTCTPTPGARSEGSSSRCRCPACSPAASWSSSRLPAIS
jgi:spermidine/putrescine transport system permease protein